MAELPSGTVTFLFTDVEGSTRLLHEHGEAYADLLGEHRRLLREAFRRHGGVEVDTQGDAFFYAFERASDALAAAQAGQEALTQTPVRVRIGIHTGEPRVTDEGYVGLDVHKAARIAAAGHGGQVLVSEATARLADEDVLVDLGLHRLRDLGVVRLFQAGKRRFPPPRSLSATNLPLPATPLLGRKRELAAVLRLVRREGVRLVTVTGPGGVGKTRFAVEAAHELVDDLPYGVSFVDLGSVRDPALVVPAIAAAVAAQGDLVEHIGDKELLLVLDSLEQVADAATDIGELLQMCRGLRVLATSREPLHLSGEREYPLRPLAEAPAVELFLARAEAVDPRFEADYETLVQLAARLDHLPLALELAAARTKALSPVALLERLDRRLPLLIGRARDVPERQRALAATIAWSYELLTAEERKLFGRLSVFAGGWTLEAATEVADAVLDTLESLVDKSLVESSKRRYRLLETIREYASERLEESGEADELRRRHAGWFASRTDGLWPELIRGSKDRWREVEDDLANFHAALALSFELEDGETAAAIVGGLWLLWSGRGYATPARGWAERAISLTAGTVTRARGDALVALNQLARAQGDLDTWERASEEALALFRTLGDHRFAAAALTELADSALDRGQLERARSLAEESMRVRREFFLDDVGVARTLSTLGAIALAEGDVGSARALFDEAHDRYVAQAPESLNRAGVLVVLGGLALRERDFPAALEHLREALRLSARYGDERRVADCLEGLAGIAHAQGDDTRAAKLAGAAEARHAHSDIPADQLERQPERPELVGVEPAWSEGRAMTLDEAVAYALSTVD